VTRFDGRRNPFHEPHYLLLNLAVGGSPTLRSCLRDGKGGGGFGQARAGL